MLKVFTYGVGNTSIDLSWISLDFLLSCILKSRKFFFLFFFSYFKVSDSNGFIMAKTKAGVIA
jgi:hypothetical protein